jgi:two-component system cell cycle sensor histidine kinase/response regulator CckA
VSLPGDLVKLTIHDEGVGISEENLSKIFNPYFTTKEGGSGLGLTTVHSIIVKHHGAIGVDSELGVGTTFTIHLPAINSTSQDIASFNSNEPEHRQSVSAHILVVDDEEAIRQLSSDMLKSFGHSVITAGDGEEAIEKYIAADKGNDPFDVVIMDLTIPGGMGGKEAVEKLLAIDSEARIIVWSGYSTDPIMANYVEFGIKGRIVKPFQMRDLEKEISQVLALG